MELSGMRKKDEIKWLVNIGSRSLNYEKMVVGNADEMYYVYEAIKEKVQNSSINEDDYIDMMAALNVYSRARVIADLYKEKEFLEKKLKEEQIFKEKFAIKKSMFRLPGAVLRNYDLLYDYLTNNGNRELEDVKEKVERLEKYIEEAMIQGCASKEELREYVEKTMDSYFSLNNSVKR